MVEGMKIPGTSRRCGAGPGGLVNACLTRRRRVICFDLAQQVLQVPVC
jgi:hypothetical protein